MRRDNICKTQCSFVLNSLLGGGGAGQHPNEFFFVDTADTLQAPGVGGRPRELFSGQQPGGGRPQRPPKGQGAKGPFPGGKGGVRGGPSIFGPRQPLTPPLNPSGIIPPPPPPAVRPPVRNPLPPSGKGGSGSKSGSIFPSADGASDRNPPARPVVPLQTAQPQGQPQQQPGQGQGQQPPQGGQLPQGQSVQTPVIPGQQQVQQPQQGQQPQQPGTQTPPPPTRQPRPLFSFLPRLPNLSDIFGL